MKKGQITMFVIIGVVLLLAAGLYFSISSELSKDKPVLDVPDVSLETRPANQLITSCLESTAELAIRKISAQGGYINTPDANYYSYKGSFVVKEPHNIAFWRYLSEDAGCFDQFGCPDSKKPHLCKLGETCPGTIPGENSIQESIEQFILDNIDDCLLDLVSISDFYDVELGADRDVEVQFTQGKTTVVLTNTLTTTSRSTDNTKSQERFLATLDIDMLKMYDIASELLDFIQQSNYYETQTMNLVSVYSCADSDCLPPTDELSFNKGKSTFWVQQVVQNTLETEVLPLMTLTSYQNFDNYDYTTRPEGEDFGEYNPYIDGIYGKFSPDFNGERINGYDLNHEYLYSPILFQIDNGDQIIQPKEIDMGVMKPVDQILSFALSDMRFNYFMSYPLVLTLTDTDAFYGRGMDFSFAIEVNIAGNRPAYDPVLTLNTGSNFAARLDSPQYLVDREVTIRTTDKYTRAPLNNVVLSYVCLDQYDIGMTSLTPSGTAEFVGKLPNCESGGYLKYSKLGYAGGAIPFNNPEDGPAVLPARNIELWPIVDKEIIVYRRSPQNIYDVANAGTKGIEESITAFSELSSSQTALVQLSKHKDNIYDDTIPLVGIGVADGQADYSQFNNLIDVQAQLDLIEELEIQGEISQDEADNLREVLEEYDGGLINFDEYEPQPIVMGVVPGKYDLELTMFEYSTTNPVTGEYIPALKIEEQEKLVRERTFAPDEYITLEPIELSTWVPGGGNVIINLDEENVYESDEPIKFYALELPKPTHWHCDYLKVTSPDDTSCNPNLGFCGVWVPEDPSRYCVSFEDYPDIEDFQLSKQYLVAPGLLSFS